MTGKGRISALPARRLKILLSLQILWHVGVAVLGAWWWTLLGRQAARIAELERALGIDPAASASHWERTQRMLFGESASFFALIVVISGAFFWMYWRDAKRTRGLQAFFASVTHELRTPLTSIRLQAESIAESLPKGSPETSNVESLLQRLLEDAARLESQVERTLELARVEGGGKLYVEPLNAKPWFERAVEAARQNYGARLEVQANYPKNPILADPSAIQVIARNLIENSLRHGAREDGPVRVDISFDEHNEHTLIRFRDNGPGYAGDPSQLGQLFQKGKDSHGAGVGLYLAKVLMDRMGGELKLASAPGHFEATLVFQRGPA